MIRLTNVALRLNQIPVDFKAYLAKLTGWGDIVHVQIAKRSIDARKKPNVVLLYSFDVEIAGDELKAVKSSLYKDVTIIEDVCPFEVKQVSKSVERPIIIGTGPAGFMAGLALAQAGLKPILIERGKAVNERKADVDRFWQSGDLNLNSNVQFGEGGAGTFSDGKLNSGIKKDAFTKKVLQEFVAAGAPEEIMYDGKPHIGTDNLWKMVVALRRKITDLGGEYRFETVLSDVVIKNGEIKAVKVVNADGNCEEIPASNVILAIGHSARDTFEMLHNRGVAMVQKPFAVGVRVEHLQSFMNKTQYGAEKTNPQLGAADYKFAVHMDNGRGVYSFCMCPGGVVVAAASEQGRLVTNGMSYYARDQINANAAMLVEVKTEDFQSDHPLAGVEFQRRIEESAFKAGGGNYKAPVQCVGDFIEGRETKQLGGVLPSYQPGVEFADMRAVLPTVIANTMRESFRFVDQKIRNYSMRDAVMTGAETRSSSPVRIMRDLNSCESVNVAGLYPCGEGAGYAGGIMSAAVDGLRCASKIIDKSA